MDGARTPAERTAGTGGNLELSGSGPCGTGRKKHVRRRRVRPVLNWDGSLYNDEIPDPESPEVPDEPERT